MTRMAALLRQKRMTQFVVTLSLLVLMSPGMSQAQTTNITSSGLGTDVQPPVAGTTSIVGGTTAGPNLFHSFRSFSIGPGEMARFETNNGVANANISNILSRVTGGSSSNILGTINSQTFFPNANLFLLNPAGFVFGANATINVGGSFAASTADYLKMSDGAKFYVNPAQPTVLSLAPVAAFGFLGPNPASITIQGSSLRVPTGQSLSLVGGDVTMVGGALTAPSGQINLASVASAGEVVPNPPGQSQALNVNSFTQLGLIQMSQGARIDASGNLTGTGAGGTVVIRSGRLTLDNSFIHVETVGSVEGAPVGVDVQVSSLSLTAGGAIAASTSGPGQGGNIMVRANTITMDGFVSPTGAQGTIASGRSGLMSYSSSLTGNAGGLFVTAPTINMTNRALLGATQGTSTQGFLIGHRAGAVSVTTGNLSLSGDATIASTDGVFNSRVPSAPITINAAGSVTLLGTASAIGTSGSFGDGGDIAISTPFLKIDSANIRADNFASKVGGDIMLDVGKLEVTNGGLISSFATLSTQ